MKLLDLLGLAGRKVPATAAGIEFPFANDPVSPRVAIGAVGGSGTRVLARILQQAGLRFIDDHDDLNEMQDNLWFTLLFKQRGISEIDDAEFDERLRIFIAANVRGMPLNREQLRLLHRLYQTPRPDPQNPLYDKDWLFERFRKLVAAAADMRPRLVPWGWKEPNTHLCIDRLLDRLPQLKYVHLIRNGLDMAYSDNLGQLSFWGESVLGRPVELCPRDALAYWRAVHERVFRIARAYPGRVLFVCFEDLCATPEREIRRLLDFLEMPASKQKVQELAVLVNKPATIGRYRQHGLDAFNPDDVAYVRQLGYCVSDWPLPNNVRADLLPQELPLQERLARLLDGVEGWMPLPEAQFLCEQAMQCGGDVVEIGSYRGRSTLALAYGLHLAGGNGMVHAVEPHAPATGMHGGHFGPRDRGFFFANVLSSGLVERIALINLPSLSAARAWDKPISLLFIDGDHHHEQVRQDAAAWLPHLQTGGVAIFDDAREPQDGPSRVVAQLLESGAFRPLARQGKLQALRKC